MTDANSLVEITQVCCQFYNINIMLSLPSNKYLPRTASMAIKFGVMLINKLHYEIAVHVIKKDLQLVVQLKDNFQQITTMKIEIPMN